MPAVSICDTVSAVVQRSLDAGQSKSTDELSITLTGSATRILETEIKFEEAENYHEKLLDPLKAKYIVLSLPNTENNEGGLSRIKDSTSVTVKKKDAAKMVPTLPEPQYVLYPSQKVTLGWKDTLPVGAGMFNVGNTCYLNSTLQALFHVPALVNWLLSDSHHNSKCEQNGGYYGGGECLTCAVAKTLQFSHQKSGSAIKPFYVYNKLKLICRTMVPGQQEDAHEFLRYLLEGMERAYLNRYKASKLDSYSKETTPVNQIFGGYIRTEVKCLECHHVSTTFQHFQDLLVDIRKATTLDEALTSYFSREQLDNNDYKCEACKRRVPATKQFRLERPPKVLCVQLKRFSVLGGKISRHIGFKQTVDMAPYLWREPGDSPKPLTYKLMSIVTHMGPSVNCGHYTAVAQVSTGQYYSFDDSCVRPISLSNVLSTNAYIMIFEMEPEAQVQNTPIKLNGISKTVSSSSMNGPLTKSTNQKPSTSGMIYVNGSVNGSPKVKDSTEGPIIGPQLPPQRTQQPTPTAKNLNFIGPQLPQKSQEKSQSKFSAQMKNGKVSNGSSLVAYDCSSDEEDSSSAKNNATNPPMNNASSSLFSLSSASMPKSNSSKNNTTNNVQKSTASVKDSLPKIGKETLKVPKNGIESTANGTNSSSKTLNNSVLNCAKTLNGSSSVKSQSSSSKAESNGNAKINGKEKWHHQVRLKSGQDERISTKAATSIKGWQVSKDVPSPSSGTVPNGWSVTENKDESRTTTSSNSTAPTPSAAAPRSFNGTNRSDTVSHLLKMSHRGYGNASVSNWNGNRAHLEREVDNERREERKRHYDPENEEIDKGRTKKVKTHHEYQGRSNPGYNPFQEYQNGKSWNRSLNNNNNNSNNSNGNNNNSVYYNKRHYYNTSSHHRRHASNHRPQHYRHHHHHHQWHRG